MDVFFSFITLFLKGRDSKFEQTPLSSGTPQTLFDNSAHLLKYFRRTNFPSNSSAYSRVSFFIKLKTYRLKKDSCIDLVLRVLPIILEHVFCLITASAKYRFLCCVDFSNKILRSILVMFWLSFNIFRATTVSRLRTAISGIVYFMMIRQAISPKCCEIRHCAKSVRIWSYFGLHFSTFGQE